jgi:hypothetical protein
MKVSFICSFIIISVGFIFQGSYVIASSGTILTSAESHNQQENESDVWIIIRDDGKSMEIPGGQVIRLTGYGGGKLNFITSKHLIKIPVGDFIEVDGEVPSGEQELRGNNIVKIYDQFKDLLWELSLNSKQNNALTDDDTGYNSDFTLGVEGPEVMLIQFKPARGISGVFNDHQRLIIRTISRVILGIDIKSIKGTLAGHLGIPPGKAMVVSRILKEGILADGKGFNQYDVITDVDNKSITTINELWELIRKKKIGGKLSFHIIRRGKSTTITFVVGQLKPEQQWVVVQ